jgi:hypothetical protein
MLSAESLGTLLLALATRNPDRAKNLVQTSKELSDEERSLLFAPLVASDDPAVQVRAIGDAVRAAGQWDFFANECYRTAFYLGDGLDELRKDELFAYFRSNRAGRVLDKWVHYFPIYSRHLAPYRGRPVRVLEIGIYQGGSLDMWRWYLGEQATFVGIDIDPRAREATDPRHVVEIGDQTDAEFLRRVAEEHGPFDIIIDDGGHEMRQQIVTAETLFPQLADGGLFLVEDCHTSYWDSHDGGLKREGTFMEWVKDRVDDVNGYHRSGDVDRLWTDHVAGIHCYDSVVVLDKKARFAPFAEQAGHAEFLMYPRSVAQVMTELVATRDAALAERDAARAANSERGDRDEEIRALRAELAALRPSNARLSFGLKQTRAELETTRRSLRDLRRSGRARLSGLRRGDS